MSVTLSVKWTSAAAGLLLACAPKIDTDPTVTQSASPIALFAPATDPTPPCDGVLPYPSDLAKNPTTGKLDGIPICPTDDAQTVALKTGLRTLDGYSLNTPVTMRFSRPIDPATLAGAVVLLNTATGAPVATQVLFAANDTNADPLDDNTLYILPAAPLTEHTMYVAVVSNDVTGLDGLPVISDQVFTFAKSTTPLVDQRGYSTVASITDDAQAATLDTLRLGLAPLFTMLANVNLGHGNLTRDKVALAWSFTTQTVHAPLVALAAMVSAVPPVVTQEVAVPPSLFPGLAANGLGGGLDCVYAGTMKLTNLVTATGTFGLTAAGLPEANQIDIDYILTTPKSLAASCTSWVGASSVKVAVFAHGLGRCRYDALAIADSFGANGWATLSLDGPHAGDRLLADLGDQNLDGCPDQPATPEILTGGGDTPNPFVIRDNMREWALELVQTVAAVNADAWAIAGLTKPTDATTEVALIGQSWGGMAAVLAGSVSAPGLTSVVTNAASGEMGAIFGPLLMQNIATQLTAAGLDVTSVAGQALLTTQTTTAETTFRWVLEPADPLYAAGAWPTALPVLTQVVSAGAGTVPDAPLHATATQTLLAQALLQTPAATTYVMTDSNDPSVSICDDPTALVGELLKPCSAPHLALAYGVTLHMQTQAVTFIATDGLALCTPDGVCP